MSSVKAVVYVRVSSDGQVDGTSLDTQEADCRAWCARHGYEVLRVYREAGESAKTADRPALLELLDACRAEKPAVVVCWKFDRWARNSTDHAVMAAALARHNTRLVSATEATPDDPAGRLLQTILSGIAQFDNECRSQRAKTAMAAVARRGGWVFRPPYGYRTAPGATLVEHPDEARIVRDMFAGLAGRRRTLAQTVVLARECGLTETLARKLLRAPVYAGMVKSSLTGGMLIRGTHPALVSLEDWHAAQALMAGKEQGAHVQQREEFPLRGILWCAECGRLVTACWVRGHGGRYGYYQCKAGHARGRVDRVHVAFADLLADARDTCVPILGEIRDHARDVLREELAKQHGQERDAEAAVARIRSRQKRLLDAYLDGAVAQADFAARSAELQADLDAALDRASGTTSASLDMETAVGECVRVLSDCSELWERCSLPERQKLAKVFFGNGLILAKGGTVQTSPQAGLAGAIRQSAGASSDMARLRALWANLIDAAHDLRTVA